MNKHDQKIRKQTGLIGAICGSLLIGLPAMATPGMKTEKLLSQTNPHPNILQEAPYNRSNTSTSPLNPTPKIFQEAPYNRSPSPSSTEPSASPSMMTPPTPGQEPSPSTAPNNPTSPDSVIQPPLPEEQQSPSAMVKLTDGKVSIRLVNETGANINYQVIGDTNQRSLQGKSNATLQNLATPVTVTFKRQDGGLLSVTPQASSEPGMLEVTFKETTDLGTDKSAMRIQRTGAVFLN